MKSISIANSDNKNWAEIFPFCDVLAYAHNFDDFGGWVEREKHFWKRRKSLFDEWRKEEKDGSTKN